MKIQEQRIGNLVYGIYETETGETDQIICRVVAVDETESLGDGWSSIIQRIDDGPEIEEYEDTAPIPLTEEWLIRLGFKLIETDIPFERPKMKYWVNDGICLFFNESPPDNTWLVGFADCYFGKYSVVTTDWIYYVHTIQNVYHATKGKELTLAPPQR